MLARKSRKNPIEKEIIRSDILKVAGYVRLSVNKVDQPSDSIENQEKMIQDYVGNNLDIQSIKFYVDDKTSGRDFDRPAFSEMLKDIRTGKINCTVVKDLSRLGRSMIDVGYYTQTFFPSKNVRFISIVDKIDTLDGVTNIAFGESPGQKIPLTSLLDEQYVNDISKKTQSVLNDYIKDGKYVAPRAPYGYKKSDSDCHKLVPDMEASIVVKDIFSMASCKISLNEIVRRLNADGVPSPINYAVAHGLKGNYDQGNGQWNSRTIKDILINRAYIGNLEQGKDKYIVENTHEPLVSQNVFDSVQKLFTAATNGNFNKTNIPRDDNILRGKVLCGSCGGKMQRREGSGKADWYFFTCISNNRLGAGHCTGMYIQEYEIIDAILSEAKRFVKANEAAVLKYKCEKTELETKATKLNIEIQECMGRSRARYEDFIKGIADQEDLKKVREETKMLRTKLHEAEDQIETLNEEQMRYQTFYDVVYDRQEIKTLAEKYLKNVIVYENKHVEVIFN